MAGSASYSSSKALVSNFCEAVQFELKKNVDVTVWTPGSVSSKIHVIIGESSIYTVRTEKAVADVLRQFGKVRSTMGSLYFYLFSGSYCPDWIFARIWLYIHKSQFKEAM